MTSNDRIPCHSYSPILDLLDKIYNDLSYLLYTIETLTYITL